MAPAEKRIVLCAQPIKHPLRILFACHGVCGGRLRTGRPCIVSLHDPARTWKDLENVLMCASCVRALKKALVLDDANQERPCFAAPGPDLSRCHPFIDSLEDRGVLYHSRAKEPHVLCEHKTSDSAVDPVFSFLCGKGNKSKLYPGSM